MFFANLQRNYVRMNDSVYCLLAKRRGKNEIDLSVNGVKNIHRGEPCILYYRAFVGRKTQSRVGKTKQKLCKIRPMLAVFMLCRLNIVKKYFRF